MHDNNNNDNNKNNNSSEIYRANNHLFFLKQLLTNFASSLARSDALFISYFLRGAAMRSCWLLFTFAATSAALASDPIDDKWRSYLETPPSKAVQMASELTARAESVALSVKTNGTVFPAMASAKEFDVVCSGGGDLNAYYMGIEMVLARAGLNAVEKRHAGTSAGGWMSFELKLKGERRTLESYLSYGILEDENPVHFASVLTAVFYQDHHWRIMADWQARKWNESLKELEGKGSRHCYNYH